MGKGDRDGGAWLMSGTPQRPRLQARSNEGARRTGPINPVAVCGFPGIIWALSAELCCVLSLLSKLEPFSTTRRVGVSLVDTAGLR